MEPANFSTSTQQPARWFHGGADAVNPPFDPLDDEETRELKKTEIRKHHPLGRPSAQALETINGELCIKIPDAFVKKQEVKTDYGVLTKVVSPTHAKYVPGSISFGLHDFGFHVVPPGGFIDLPGVPEKAIRSVAPHLITLAEAQARGIADEMGQPVKKSAPIKANKTGDSPKDPK